MQCLIASSLEVCQMALKRCNARGDMALDDSFFEKDTVVQYIDASMYGSKAPFSFSGGTPTIENEPIVKRSGQSIYLRSRRSGTCLSFL